jgi:hypothetical protein
MASDVNSITKDLMSHSRTTVLSSRRPVANAAAALVLLALAGWLCRAWLRTLTFDDAYMFYRYALNIRHGLGISWNPDGVPTYGMTSLPWAFVVLPLTLLPVTPGHALQLASWIVGTVAIGTVAACIVSHARSHWLRTPAIAFAAVGLPLVLNPVFAFHLATGMDTVLSILANAVMVCALVRYLDRPTLRAAFVVGALSFVAVLVRPDNGICAMGSAGLAWLILPGSKRWSDLAGLCLLPLALLGADLLACKEYFEAPLPLGFYAKSLHSYAGFQNGENAVEYAYMGASVAAPFLGALVATTVDRRQWLRVVVFLLPVAATLAYLLTVRQVMGFGGRYYIPLIPYVVVPALLQVDVALVTRDRRPLRRLALGVVAAAAVFIALRPIELHWESQYRAWVIPPPITFPALPGEPLPPYNWIKEPDIVQIVARLPSGAVVAASEVGYLGALAPRTTLIDLVGLNDTRIGLHGFSMDDLLARAPDLIWLPQEHYTGLLATMLEDPRLLERYIVVAHAFNFGIAIRCDSAFRENLEGGVRRAWRARYPSHRLSGYVVSRCSDVTGFLAQAR